MSRLKVYDCAGAEVGDLEISDDLLRCKGKRQVVHDAVTATMAAGRAGTASTKSKGQVAGSGRKPWRQKGTGRARAGYRQSPVWRGGAVAFGPHPRRFGGKVNKKAARLAFRLVLSEKLAGDTVKVLDELVVTEPKTAVLVSTLKALGIEGPALVVVDVVGRELALSARNIPRVEVVAAADVDVVRLLRYRVLVASKAGMRGLTARLGDGEVEAA